jgi:outer membrane receptor for ferrienterochelin and colicins
MIRLTYSAPSNILVRSLLVIFLFAALANSQGLSVSGLVYETYGKKPLPNANIVVLQSEIGTISDSNGRFLIAGLDAGNYTVIASVIGYERDTVNVQLVDTNITGVEFSLDLKILELDEVKIVGMLSTRLASETVDSYQSETIASEKIETLSELLQDIPGVDVQMAHQFGRNVNVSIRGSSDYKPGGYNNRVLVLLDGFPVQIPNSGAPDWNALPLENVKRIDVVHGPASSLYGHNSMGGVINIITETPGEATELSSELAVGTNETYRVGVKSGFSAGKFSIGSSIYNFSSAGFRFNSDYDNFRGLFKIHYNGQSGRTLTLTGIGTVSSTGHPGFHTSEHPDIISYRRSKRVSGYLQTHFYFPISPGITLTASGSVNRYQTDYFDRDDTPLLELGEDTKYNDISIAGRSELLFTRSTKWVILSGIESSLDRSEVTVLNPIYESPQQFSGAVFVQTRYALGKGWSLGNGLRLDYRSVNPGSGYTKREFTDFSPKINIVYNHEGKRTFHISLNKGFRAPSISELFLLFESNYGLFFQGTPTLHPERVWSVEFGYEHPHSKNIFWGMNLYYNRYREMIDFIYAIPVKAINRDGVQGYGTEFTWNIRSDWGFSFSGNYTYLQMDDFDNAAPILYRPHHKINTQLGFTGKYGSIGLSGRYIGTQRYEDFLSSDYIVEGNRVRFPIKVLPSVFIVDGIMKQSIGFIELSFKVQNIFDLEYELIQDFPMPGRTWLLSLTSVIGKN